MELFKYCRAEHWRSLADRGNVRIGTLSDFRETDLYGEMVGDAAEGSMRLAGQVRSLTAESHAIYPGLSALGVCLRRGGAIGLLDVKDCTHSVSNLLVFSTSSEYEEQAHRSWRASAGYDVCYRINSARLFFRAISRAIGNEYSFLGYSSVTYADEIDIGSAEAGAHPALVKRRSGYFGQAEVRALWERRSGGEISPLALDSSDCRVYCEIFRRLN